MEIVESPNVIIAAARSYSAEALEVIAGIMRHSQSEKMRLVAAMALLDRATVPRAPERPKEAPEPRNDLRARIVEHLTANAEDAFDEQRLRTELSLKSPPTAIRATLVQMHREGLIARTTVGSFAAK